MPFDIIYANACIDSIKTKTENLIALYKENANIATIKNLHTDVMSEISDYYKYLLTNKIPPDESYLTHWLESSDYYEYFAEIGTFCLSVP